MIGQLVDGKYQIVRILGEGGMGMVYEALHTGTGRRVALKVIIGADLAKNQDMVTRFQREAKAAGAIDTQHIVQVLDTGRDSATGFPFMVMEFLAGEDVQQLIRRVGPLPPELALRIAAQACIGLSKAHEAHVVHRDIKPANLFLSQRDAGEVVVKVLDFGIAKVKMDQASSNEGHGLTRTGSMLGSPLYMSPEQAKGLKTIDHRTDLWSLGAVLYEALSGLTPHHRVDTLGQLILAICSEPPPPIQEVAPWVPPEVAAIVHGALQMDVANRFQTGQAMLDALRALLPNGTALTQQILVGVSAQQRAVVAPRLAMSGGVSGSAGSNASGSMQRMSMPGAMGGVPATTGSQQTFSHPLTPPKRSSALPIVLGAALILGIGGATAFKLTRPKPPTEAVSSPSASAVVAAAPSASASEAKPTESAVRTVQVVIVPRNASVELDGAPVATKAGLLDVSGTLGSEHAVRVFVGARETRGNIIIAEGGAYPPKVELGVAIAAAAPPKSGTAKASAPAAAPVAPVASPIAPVARPAATASPQAARNFE